MDFLTWTVGVLAPVLATCAALGFTLMWRNSLLDWRLKIMERAQQVNDSQVTFLNDSLCELYKPSGPPRMQVLFFHGFQLGNYAEAHLSTWRSGDESCTWPQTWLAEEFKDAHILSVSYNVSLMNRESENIDVYDIQENLMSDLLQENIGQEFECPVILVGHSFGGLIIKQLCTYARQKGKQEHQNFLNSVRGVFFYATPHHGIRFPKLAEHFVNHGPLLDYVKVLSKTTARLNEDFEDLRKEHKAWLIAGIGESLPIRWGLFRASVVVTEASSRYGNDFHVAPGVDHISICRPLRKISPSFRNLTVLLNIISNASKNVLLTGARLPCGESLVSMSEKYAFKNQEDGNLCIYDKDEKVIWASTSNRPKGRRVRGDVKLLSDGNLVYYDTDGTGLSVWASMSEGRTQGPHKLVMQDDGKLVVYGCVPWSKQWPTWDSHSDTSSGHSITVNGKDEMPSDGATWLGTYDTLVSSNKKYTFINQGDGNLCVYDQDGPAIWSSGLRQGAGNVYMQKDGNLVLYNTKNQGQALWASGTWGQGTAPYKVVMQDDGNLVIYDANHTPLWATNTAR